MDRMRNMFLGCCVLAMTVAGGCMRQEPAETAAKEEVVTKAIAVLHPTAGNQAHGTVTFTREGLAMRVVAHVEGLAPGKHGFHVHQFGDCSAPDGTSAGGHFNPDNTAHGSPAGRPRHVGDLGNIEADASGVAHLELVDSLMTFSGPHSIIGRGLIVHAGEDDLTSQPTGAAGARVACGVIGIAKEEF
jgi:Cu-Zn family superoxide dismutase